MMELLNNIVNGCDEIDLEDMCNFELYIHDFQKAIIDEGQN